MRGSRLYLSQLSDGSIRNGLINAKGLDAALKVNLIFTDEFSISAPALIRNHVLFDLYKDDGLNRENLTRLVKDSIRPLLLEGNKCLVDVVKKVIGAKHFIGLSGNYEREDTVKVKEWMVEFAEYLDGQLRKENLYVKHTKFDRGYYYKKFRQVVEAELSTISSERPANNAEELAFLGLVDFLNKIVTSNDPVHPSELKVEHIYAWAEEHCKNQIIKKKIRSWAFLTMEYISTSSIAGKFASGSVSRTLMKYIVAASDRDKIQNFRDEYQSELLIPPAQFSLSAICMTPMKDILRLRRRDPFVELRKNLRKLRKGTIQINDKLLIDSCKEGAGLFRKYVESGSVSGREKILSEIDNKRHHLALLHDRANLVGICAGLGAGGISAGLTLLTGKTFDSALLQHGFSMLIAYIGASQAVLSGLDANLSSSFSSHIPGYDPKNPISEYCYETGLFVPEI